MQSVLIVSCWRLWLLNPICYELEFFNPYWLFLKNGGNTWTKLYIYTWFVQLFTKNGKSKKAHNEGQGESLFQTQCFVKCKPKHSSLIFECFSKYFSSAFRCHFKWLPSTSRHHSKWCRSSVQENPSYRLTLISTAGFKNSSQPWIIEWKQKKIQKQAF